MATSALPTPAPAVETQPTPQAIPTPTPVVESTPQQTRQGIYNKYYGSSEVEPPAEPQVSESPAQGEQTVEATPAAPAATPLPPDPTAERFTQVETQLAQIASILSQLTQPQQQAPAAPAAPAATGPTWIDLLREGKVEEAEALLAQRVANKFMPQAKSESTSEALEVFRVEQELTSYVTNLRRENPDLVELEDYIASQAETQLRAAQASGQLKDGNAYVSAYKDAVNKAVDKARKLSQKFRASGKDEAAVRSREVISSSTVAPNTADGNRGTIPAKVDENKLESTDDYIARRKQIAARSAGLVA